MLAPSMQGRADLCAVSCHGVRVRFADGRELLCGTSGLWNANLGYGNEAIADATAAALRDASFLGSYQVENIYARRAAAALVDLCGDDAFTRVLFSTSGGAANDLVLKLVRHFHVLHGNEDRKFVVAMRGGWHGLTYGAFALTSDQLGQTMYGVDRRLVAHIEPNDVSELQAFMRDHGARVAAVVVEPVLGTGVIPLDPEYVQALLDARAEQEFLVVADEVATGFGRTARYFASDAWHAPPDILITSKGLTNGTSAAAAVMVSSEIAETFAAHSAVLGHGETQAGTAVACAAMLATSGEMERLEAVELAARLSQRLDVDLARLVEDEELIVGTRGIGCMRALSLVRPDGEPLEAADVPALVAAIRREGAIVHAAPDGIQLLPALVYTDDDLVELVGCIRRGIQAFALETR